jgi:hypothetical protein
MLNNDMIAKVSTTNKSEWGINIIYYPNAFDLYENAVIACLSNSILIPVNDQIVSTFSDSQSFYTRDFEAVFFHANVNDTVIHSDKDIISLLNFEYCREATKISCALLLKDNIH